MATQTPSETKPLFAINQNQLAQPPPPPPPPSKINWPSRSVPARATPKYRGRNDTKMPFHSKKKNIPTPPPRAKVKPFVSVHAVREQKDVDKEIEERKKPPIVWPSQHRRVIKLVESGKSVFMTGSAGTGKSFLLKHLISKMPASDVAVTATTGRASIDINGQTIHAWAGIGLGEGDFESMMDGIMRNTKVLKRWRECKVLVIDEISMLPSHIFIRLEAIARNVRGISLFFGGLQVIFCGDFLQLGPIDTLTQSAEFCFKSWLWRNNVRHTVRLTHVFRQEDVPFVNALTQLRRGECSEEVRQYMQQFVDKPIDASDGIMATQLYARKRQVAEINDSELSKINSATYFYDAIDGGDPAYLASLQANCQAENRLQLKVGAQVMLLKNLDVENGLANGTLGVIEAMVNPMAGPKDAIPLIGNHPPQFTNASWNPKPGVSSTNGPGWLNGQERRLYPLVRFTNGLRRILGAQNWSVEINGKTVAYRSQVPLLLAWSLTTHKSQGSSIDRVSVSFMNCDSFGQIYVALSRVRSPKGLTIQGAGFDMDRIFADTDALAYDDLVTERSRLDDLEFALAESKEASDNDVKCESQPVEKLETSDTIPDHSSKRPRDNDNEQITDPDPKVSDNKRTQNNREDKIV